MGHDSDPCGGEGLGGASSGFAKWAIPREPPNAPKGQDVGQARSYGHCVTDMEAEAQKGSGHSAIKMWPLSFCPASLECLAVPLPVCPLTATCGVNASYPFP